MEIQDADKNARTMGMLCHLLGLLILTQLSFGQIWGPLILWLVKRDDHPFIDEQGKEALNFQISMTIYMLLCVPLVFVGIGILLLVALQILDVVLCIIAGLKANEGIAYKYPFTIRFIK